MATTRTFSAMLNEFLPNKLLEEELIKRDYILQHVPKDNSWKDGKLIVPFWGSRASSVSIGALTASTDIAESDPIRGYIDDYVEIWSTLILNQRDLQEHDGQIPETTFLRLVPNEVDALMDYTKEVVSVALCCGPHFAKVTTDSSPTDAANGVFTVDHIDRFRLKQKVVLDDDNSNAVEAYVIGINLNDSTVTVSATRGGSAYNAAAYVAAQNAKFYHPGQIAAGGSGAAPVAFNSIRQSLMPYASGGSQKLHNVTKTSYPCLQAIAASGAAISASNLLEKIFDHWVTVRTRGRGNADTILVSYKHLGSALKILEDSKGSYRAADSMKANMYGWTEITIADIKGGRQLKFVALPEMDDDVIFFIDWSTWCFYTNGFFKKRTSPDGKQYFEIRATTGYSYVIDLSLFGDLACLKASSNGILHTISY